nr:MAG TPA: hypothetical protein [Caudoviricetes sp.]
MKILNVPTGGTVSKSYVKSKAIIYLLYLDYIIFQV